MKKLIMVLALVGALSLISIASAQFTSSQTWGSFGNGTGQFYGMSGVATDTSGNIYVAELDNRVQEFSKNGTYITQFNIPARSIAIDSSGNIYATVNDSIEKFDSTGALLNTWGSTGTGNGYFNFPVGIALDSSRNMYITDMENSRIQKLDSSGNYVTSWGTLGSGNGYFKSPTGIAVSGNYVYVADMGNYRIQKFDLNGNYVSSLGSQGTGNTQFNSSIAVAGDSSGNIYVADYYNGRVIEYDSNFNYLTQYTGFSYPTALVIANNNLYVLDSGNYRVHEYYNNTVNNATPTITWSTPADIIYGTPLNETQLNAVATEPVTGNPVNGTSVYTPAAGTVLSVGIHTLHVDFTPADTANYTNASKEVTINVSLLPVANFTATPTSGNAPLSVQFNDISENATAWFWNFGDGQTSTTQNPIHTYSSPGTYTISLNASNTVGYNISTKPNLIYVNSVPPVTDGLVVYYNGSLSGNSLVDLSGNNNTGYATSVTQGTNQSTGANYINLNGLNSKIDISNNAQTNISSPLSIEFIGSINKFTKYGAFVSKYSSGPLGWYLSCSPTAPYNNARFSAVTRDGTQKLYHSNISLVAGKVYDIVATYDNSTAHIYVNGVDSADPRIWSSPISGSNNNITIGSGYYLNYGNCSMYTVRLYNRSLSSAEILQNYNNYISRPKTKTTPTITWSNPAAINYGTALNETQLNASASIPGSFVYNPASGTILGVGIQTLQTTFTPIDSTNYTTATSNVSLIVNKATPLVTWSDPANITYGTPLSETQLNAVATDSITGSQVNGTFVYTPAAGTNLSAGTHTLHVDFTPTDAANYSTASKDVTINVSDPILPVANFTTNVTSGTLPLTIQFYDGSLNTTGWYWDFGDGSNSTVRNPVHTYFIEGNYTVNLTASNANGTDSKLVTIHIPPIIPLPVANFSCNVTSGNAPLTVQFNDSSLNAAEWNWNFGDGNNSTVQNPVHTYFTAGNYTVNLTVSNANGTNSKEATINVSVPITLVLPVANFTANKTQGTAPLTVQFNDTSTNNPTTWNWNFGDGANSTDQNPVHIFNEVGVSNVTLVVTNGNGSDSKSINITVNRAPTPPVADFEANRTNGFAPLTVQFNDTSTNNPTAWNWSFGDGSNSSLQNPVHTYSEAGNYTVNLTVSNEDGTNSKLATINISEEPVLPVLPVANFTSNTTSGFAPLIVQFNDISENADSRNWDFENDGMIDSTDPNPVHTFVSAGSYEVNLTAINGNGTNSKLATITVSEEPVLPVLPVANFTANVTSGYVPLSVQFNDSSENATAWFWNFGDGQTSTTQNPTHTYSSAGTYTVSLNASNDDGYNVSTKPNLITVSRNITLVTNGLVAYYDGNLSGNSLLDLSGNNNTGYATSVTQGTNQSTGANYINLNGVNSKIDLSNNAQTNISSPVSIEFIGSINTFKRYGAIVSKYNNGLLGWYLSCSSTAPYNNARFGAGLKNGGLNWYHSNISLVAGKVYDIVVTYDNSTAHIYVNGMDSAGPRTWNSPIAGINNNITIGYGSGLTYCNCSMYTVRLYNRSLSSAEVLQNYNNDLWRYTTN